MERGVCPLEEGDRIDHKKFGSGTVDGPPMATVGPDLGGRGGVRDAGWSVPVRWDDVERQPTRVAHWALTKVPSPDSRPFTYWDRQWKPFVAAWLAARRAVETATVTFRPPPDPAAMQALQADEADAFAAMTRFLKDETDGLHV
ncbi:hypothetical protein LJR225_003485 [Phenylobacterium sp. LjRoot225]|uniref:hypothetical protein n=1 Tax=Phenylobacterium sp. LjRoot225 TaxID=3342285 RepID=UPI003ED13836